MKPSGKPKPRIRVVGICGSLRKGSYTQMALSYALKGAREFGAETQLINLREYELVFFGMNEEEDYPADVARLREDVGKAQGILLGTPVYHGSMSGVLKNALDLMGFEEFEGKMIGLVGVSGGRLGAGNALNSLRSIGRTLHAWVLPQEVSIPEAHNYFDREGNITDPELKERLLEIGRSVAKFATFHEMQRDQEFIKLWESLPINPGGEK